MKKLLILWMITVMLIATSCNDNQPSTQQIAISKVANYAQNGNSAPTIQDCIDGLGINLENNITADGIANQINETNETNGSEENTTTPPEETNTSASPVIDITPPTITILDTNPIALEALSSYSDAGATTNEENATLTQSGEVNTTKVSVYTITYRAVDSSGNAAEANRTINVVDTTKPVITLNGDANVAIEKGGVCTELGATA